VTPDVFARLFNPLPHAYLLVRSSGLIEAANREAQRLLGTHATGQGSVLPAISENGAVQRYLHLCCRSGSLLPGAVTLQTAEGPARFRAHCGAVEHGHDPLLLLQLEAQASASQQFLALNEKIAQLNREISERRRAQEQLQEQATELEHMASELEQTVEELQEQSEAAGAAQNRAERVAQRMSTLADAGDALASSLDARDTLQQLAEVAVRALADYCITYVIDEDGNLRRTAGAHADPALRPEIDRLIETHPIERGGVTPILLSGQAALATEIPKEMLVRAAADEDHLQILLALNPTSSIVAPFQARGRTVGAIAVARSTGRTAYNADDLSVVEELASRAALVLDNSRLYDEAQRASRAKSAFLATMSHELRTPLNAIVGYTDLLDAEIAGTLVEGQKQQLSRIRSAADHLRSIIEEILSFARIEANKEQLRTERVDIGSVVSDSVELMRPSLEHRNLQLELNHTAGVSIETDPGKLKQILLNLLGNAVKFTISGRITVTVSGNEQGARIAVSDTGIGIPAADVARIFEPFWQVDYGTTRHVGGTGLGLTVSRRLAQLMGGDITVESELGRGSTFILSLPQEPPATSD
jgi:signal transduction histidine kinase